jgi:4'-phosphopantetheinyl transferase
VNNYIIAKEIKINSGIQLFLLPVSANTRHCNKTIIPQIQIDEIGKYKIKKDADKRMLARSFLYEYLLEQFYMHDFELGYNEYKKPFLTAYPGINFSFSYAGDYVLVGLSQNKKIGVDIEYVHPNLMLDEISREIMCPAEWQQYKSLAKNTMEQRMYFYHLFSAKEAIIKAFGTGLYFDVGSLQVSDHGEYDYLGTKFIYRELGFRVNQFSFGICYEK